MKSEEMDKDWKLKLRYGKLKTPYSHFTTIAEGVAGSLTDGFACPPGSAFMTMKIWAVSADDAADMIAIIGKQIGFTVTGRIYVYDTAPTQPPRDTPFGYGIHFVPFDSKKK